MNIILNKETKIGNKNLELVSHTKEIEYPNKAELIKSIENFIDDNNALKIEINLSKIKFR